MKGVQVLQPPSTGTTDTHGKQTHTSERGKEPGQTRVPGQEGRWVQGCTPAWSPAQPRPGGLVEGAGLVQERRRVLVAGRPSGLQEDEQSLQLDHPDQNPSTGGTDRQTGGGQRWVGVDVGGCGRASSPGHLTWQMVALVLEPGHNCPPYLGAGWSHGLMCS